jgi:hypothetical protein
METKMAPRSYQVFLSHGGGDNYLVDQLLAPRLEKTGAHVFVDSGAIKFGDNFRTTIFEELRRSDELVVLLTPTSVLRPWVFAELGAAIMHNMRIVAVIYGAREADLQENGVLSLIGTNHFLVLDAFDEYLDQLAERVKGNGNG